MTLDSARPESIRHRDSEWVIDVSPRRHFEPVNDRWLAISSAAGPFAGLVVNYGGGVVDAFGGPEGEEQVTEVRSVPFGDATNPLNQHRVFLEAARDGKSAPVSIASGVRDMHAVAAVYESAQTGRAVEVR